MIEERMHGDDGGYVLRRVGLPASVPVCPFEIRDPAGSPEAPLLRFMERVPPAAETRGVSAIRRIVSAIGLWRTRARSQELCEPSDHEPGDIYLGGEDVRHRFPEAWYRD
jgi:hypothetical protein